MICKHCGKTIKDGSKFCLYCGQKVEEKAAVNIEPEKEKQATVNVGPEKEKQAAVKAEPEKEIQATVKAEPEKEKTAAVNAGSGKEGQAVVNVGAGKEKQTATAASPGKEEQAATAASPRKEVQAAVVKTRKEEASNAQETKKKRSKMPIVAAAVVVVIVIAVVATHFFSPEPSQPSNGDKTQNAVASLTPKPSHPSDKEENKNTAASLTPKPTQPDSSNSIQASVAELLSYVDQAEKISLEVYEDIDALFEEDYAVERFQKAAEMSKELLDDLLKLQQQAAAVSDIEPKLENAGKEYFSMLCDSQKVYYELWLFAADFMEVYMDILVNRPDTDNYYNEPEGYYDLLYAWYLSAKEGYSAITSCPSHMEGTWKRYGDALDLNLEIAYRLYEGDTYFDRLRILSALCMANRYNTVKDLLFTEIVNCLDGEEMHALGQLEAASELAEEMHAYTKMKEEERGRYEFQCIRTGEVSVSYSAVETIYPSLYNSYDAFVVIKAGCISGTKRVVVEAEIEGLTQSYKDTITLDSAYREIRIKPPALTGNLDLSLEKKGQIRVTISASDGSWSEEKTFPINIKSKYDFELYNDEYGAATRDNLLCFLTPEAMELAQLERQAALEISNMTNGQMDSFVGYQETGWNHYTGTYLQAAGIMRALNVMGIKYINGAFSLSEGSHQHILFPKDVLQEQGGLCIETALLVASTLQRAGMHAYILLPPGHAQVAVEIWNGAGDDITGTGEYFLIETTALSDSWNNQNVFVADANALVAGKVLNESPIVYYNEQGWYQYIQEYDPYIIDCNDSKVFGMMPFAN